MYALEIPRFSDYIFVGENDFVASFNIIDLIEVGDYVNGYKVTAIYNPNGDEMYCITILTPNEYEEFIHYDKEIKSIVTKEQFKNNEYAFKK